MSLGFVAVIEPGMLEDQAVLLFRSIRAWAGRYREAPIMAYQPRDPTPLRMSIYRELEELGVELRTETLNTRFSSYPFANKILAAAHAEDASDAEILVVLDTDTLFAAEPVSLDLRPGGVIAARPVNARMHGTTGPGHPMEPYWLRLYELCGARPGPFVETTVSRERVRAYWNTGLVACRRSAGVLGRWLENFSRLMAARHFPSDGRINQLEAISFAGTVAGIAEGVDVLDGRHNYPLPSRSKLLEPFRSAPLEQLVHVHYFRWLNKPGFLDSLEPSLPADSPLTRWLSSFLPLRPTVEDPSARPRYYAR